MLTNVSVVTLILKALPNVSVVPNPKNVTNVSVVPNPKNVTNVSVVIQS